MLKNFESIRAVIFDMDGTLLDSMWAWRGENRKFLARHGYPVPEDLEGGIDTLSSHAFARRFAGEHPDRFTVKGIMDEYIDQMVIHYHSDVFPKKGAKAFLEGLKTRGVRLCVATATPKDIAREALSVHGLDGYFDFITDDEEMGVPKSEPAFFDLAAKRLGVPKQACAIFEDSFYAMQSAVLSGVTALAIEERVHQQNASLTEKIRSIASLFVKDFDEAAERLF